MGCSRVPKVVLLHLCWIPWLWACDIPTLM
uniref:Uncharacterized protein n=1 Tax=Vitis vinifera TaxID=29760 RepID=F6GUX7_VITVI